LFDFFSQINKNSVVYLQKTYKKMKIAIIGAGFSGLAACWHISQSKKCSITLFDSKGVGSGASGVATGLLHPYVGLRAKKNWKGDEGFQTALDLIELVAKKTKRPIFLHRGLVRLAMTIKQEKDFRICADTHTDTVLWESAQLHQEYPMLEAKPSLFIPNGVGINSNEYLKGLWDLCNSQGVKFKIARFHSLSELDNFDHILVATGVGNPLLQELQSLPFTKIKGQCLVMQWPSSLPPLKHAIIGRAYITRGATPDQCYVGSTFEHEFTDDKICETTALSHLLPRIKELLPELVNSKVIAIRSGIRCSLPNRLPQLVEVNKKTTLLWGMGAKGLLYHAYFGKRYSNLLASSFQNK